MLLYICVFLKHVFYVVAVMQHSAAASAAAGAAAGAAASAAASAAVIHAPKHGDAPLYIIMRTHACFVII